MENVEQEDLSQYETIMNEYEGSGQEVYGSATLPAGRYTFKVVEVLTKTPERKTDKNGLPYVVCTNTLKLEVVESDFNKADRAEEASLVKAGATFSHNLNVFLDLHSNTEEAATKNAQNIDRMLTLAAKMGGWNVADHKKPNQAAQALNGCVFQGYLVKKGEYTNLKTPRDAKDNCIRAI